MKTIVIRVGKGADSARKRAPRRVGVPPFTEGGSPRRDSSGKRYSVLYRRANVAAVLGAAVCVAFIVVSLSRNESSNEPSTVLPELSEVVAVAASADMSDVPLSGEPASAANPAVVTVYDAAESGTAAVTGFEPAEPNSTESGSAAAPDESEDRSVWSYLERFLRRLMRRESD